MVMFFAPLSLIEVTPENKLSLALRAACSVITSSVDQPGHDCLARVVVDLHRGALWRNDIPSRTNRVDFRALNEYRPFFDGRASPAIDQSAGHACSGSSMTISSVKEFGANVRLGDRVTIRFSLNQFVTRSREYRS